jgi:hypothetical protein
MVNQASCLLAVAAVSADLRACMYVCTAVFTYRGPHSLVSIYGVSICGSSEEGLL